MNTPNSKEWIIFSMSSAISQTSAPSAFIFCFFDILRLPLAVPDVKHSFGIHLYNELHQHRLFSFFSFHLIAIGCANLSIQLMSRSYDLAYFVKSQTNFYRLLSDFWFYDIWHMTYDLWFYDLWLADIWLLTLPNANHQRYHNISFEIHKSKK